MLLSFFIFLFGLCIGSFLNAVIYRLSLPGFSFWKNLGGTNRSYCPHCKHVLRWQDLVPVFSFLFLRGKCRYCQKKISWQYPIVEITTGLIFLIIFNFSLPVSGFIFTTREIINVLLLFYVASSLIIIFVYDLKYYLIPDSILFPAIGVTFLYRLFDVPMIGNYLLAAIIASGFFLSIFLVSKGRWMGFGDVKLAILLGLLLGFPVILVGLFLSFFFGAIIGVVLLFLKEKGLKSEMPFAPFLIVGTFIAMLFGSELIDWYFQFLVF